jgi:PmbA protein
VSGADDEGAELRALVARVAADAGAGEQVEAYAARGRATTVKAYGGEVESLTVAESAGVGVRVVLGDRQGFAHCGTLEPGAVAATLAEARDNARYAEPDPWAGLADPDGVAAVAQELWDPAVGATATEDKVALALDLEARTTSLDPRVRAVRTAVYGDGAGEAAVASSRGIEAWGRSTVCSVSVSAMAEDGDELRMGYGYDVARDPAELSVEWAATDAVDRAVRLLGARPVPSGRVAIVLEPRLAATVVGILAGTLTGERVVKGRSPFADRVGEAIASPLLTLVDDPTDARSMGAESHDGEGLACRRNVLVEGGHLVGFLHNAWTGRRAGTGSTGSAVRGYRSTPGVGVQALAVAPGSGTLDELVASVGDGLLVQSLTGLHSGVNAVSGDVSVGAEGIRISGGRLAEPVREVTLASTLQRMALDVEAVGGDVEWLPGGTGTPSLVIGGIQLSGS